MIASPAGENRVLIVGAGLAGLCLAIILEKANVPYELFERATEIRPLGAAITLGVNVLPFFKQIGIFEEFVSLSKPAMCIDNYNEKRELVFSMDFTPVHALGGGLGYVLPRSGLYDLLLRQIPSHKIHLKKRILSMAQGDKGVRIVCQDNSAYDGEILVGADGAYSAVRTCLYESMKNENKLPKSDGGVLPYSCVCLVGQTQPLDPDFFPDLPDPVAKFNAMKSETKPYSWNVITAPGNRYCWSVIQYLDEESSKENDSFRSSEWGSESAVSMCKEVRDFPIVGATGPENFQTLGALIDNTPKDLISKVMLEEKVFSTWYYQRTVHPASGAGAVNAITDAIVLGNWIVALPDRSLESLEKAFKEYRNERYDAVMVAYNNGRLLSKVNAKATWKSKAIRYMTQNTPNWLWQIMMKRMAENRPQLWMLDQVEDKGTVPPKAQPSLQKNLHLRRK
ncbi:hypothetical protein BGZ83_012057 [Gryganskiella cystojenkinii]|nr:hypothetical protein BGZ83_012057 [Gryganskiella cystojenkinii]